MINGQNIYLCEKISKVFNLKDGTMPTDVENGLTWLEIHLMMKLN